MTLEELQKITQKDIREKFNELSNEIDKGGYLDHAVRAYENFAVREVNVREIRLAKAEGRPIKRRVFHIDKHAQPIPKGQGSVLLYKFGADVFYPQMTKHGGATDVSRIHTIFAIAHELGHAVLGHLQIYPNSKSIKDDTLESQASYFAKLIVQSRSDQYNDVVLRKEHTFTPQEIERAINNIHVGYDENLIPKG